MGKTEKGEGGEVRGRTEFNRARAHGHRANAADTLAGDFRAQVAEVKQELKRMALLQSHCAQSLVCACWKCCTMSNPWKTAIHYRAQQESVPICGLTLLLLDFPVAPATKPYCYRITGDPTQHIGKKPPSETDCNLDF